MIHLIKGRHDVPARPITADSLRAANDDVFDGLVLPNLRTALRVVASPKERIAERVADDTAKSIGELVHGDLKGGLRSLARAFAGGAGMIAGAMIGTAVGGAVGSIVGMTLGGAVVQFGVEWLLGRTLGAPASA